MNRIISTILVAMLALLLLFRLQVAAETMVYQR